MDEEIKDDLDVESDDAAISEDDVEVDDAAISDDDDDADMDDDDM